MLDYLMDRAIVAEIRRAWLDSQADDPTNRHEEGGYIVLNADLSHAIERWPKGAQSRIVPPPLDAHRCYNGKAVVATFHTHPNPPIDEAGREWDQGPSASDRRWHERCALAGLVVSRTMVFEIDADGKVLAVGPYDEVLLT